MLTAFVALLLLPSLASTPRPQEAQPARGVPRLPEGSTGIAARYPRDAGIERDERVLFVERFDQGRLEQLIERWESVKHPEGLAFSDDVPEHAGDARSLQVTHVGGQGTGSHLYRRLPPGHERVFARFYVKFSEDCAPVHHFGTHLGGYHPSTPWPQGGAGERPAGDARFHTGLEPYGEDWSWDFYTYWQGMRVHGDGNYWGTPFHSGVERAKVERGRWICVELMLRLNDPVGEPNGEQAFWIDGKLWRQDGQVTSHIGPGFPRGRWRGGWWSPDATAQESFEGFRWRSTEELAINYLWTYLYVTQAPEGHRSRVWFDHVVVAEEYIGPLAPEPEPAADEDD